MSNPTKNWIQTLENKMLIPRRLQPEMVGSIEEIAHSLAGEFRFTRQTKQRYTVAQHCIEGSKLLPAAFAGAFLLHELSETYLPDVAGPLKPLVFVGALEDWANVISWSELERQHTKAILEALGLSSIEPLIYSPEVKTMDLAMLAAEKRDLCGKEPEDWHLTVPPANVSLREIWAPHRAEAEFLTRFKELFDV
jgi:hypothetical protein